MDQRHYFLPSPPRTRHVSTLEGVQDISQFRRNIYKAPHQAGLIRVIEEASKTTRDDSRSDTIELVRPAKIRELTTQFAPDILINLGLKGPGHYGIVEKSSEPNLT